ncbi:3-galactosyl-N-acetylglucosaminide 4-alpha-L-fucosyltransferase FUT3-like [Gastrophryne carolinensis]
MIPNNEVQTTQSKPPLIQTTPAIKETIILVWNWPWGQTFALDKCEDYGFPGCKLTQDRSLYNTADAVIMHHADIMHNKNSLPKEPRPNFQRWVWCNREPPMILTNVEMFDNVFNMTMSFRQDSDVFIPYGQLEALKEPQPFTIPYNKTMLVAWVVSKWYPGIRRISYYEELKKHINISMYGRQNQPLGWGEFHSALGQYKFYLSFENSMYKDYITEKLWRNAFGSWAVPVVLGTTRANYERFVPGDSFIHVDDFRNPKELADYLYELDKDDEKYLKYFTWRSRYIVKVFRWNFSYCKACAVIKQSPKYQTIQNLSGWFLRDV